MTDAAKILLALGSVLLLGVATDAIGRRTPLPRVTLLLIFGFSIGPGWLNLLPDAFVNSFDLATDMALVMIGFLLGGQFTLRAMRERGRQVLWISILAVVVTAAVVFAALVSLGVGLPLALLLAGIAPATAPAATFDVVREAKAQGPFTQRLLGVVAVDDAWGLVLFSFCSAAAAAISGLDGFDSPLTKAVWEIGGAIVLGILLGLPAAYLTGRIQPGEPTLSEALGVVFLCGGLAIWLDVSFLISSMVVGVVVVNLAKHHSRPFHAIENIEWPFMVVFFVLAGASLELAALKTIGLVAGVYVIARAVGRIAGAWAGGMMCRAERPVCRWIGLALMPQAGVALGMALVASNRMPQFTEMLLPIVISSTVFFELTGPVLTRYALHRVGEA
jgi:Kef-type K+ transport system membrane component KefB